MGDAASGLIGFGGDTVQNAANAGGNMLRDLGEEVGLETPFDAMAGFVEGGGQLVSDVADGTGQVVDTVADVVGEGVEAVSGFVGNADQGISDMAGKPHPRTWFCSPHRAPANAVHCRGTVPPGQRPSPP